MEIERRILKATWEHDGNLEPLYEVEDKGDEIFVTFDLPLVRKENIAINTTENTVEVTAKMSDAVCWARWGVVQKKITFQAFRKQIKLPEPIEPEKAQASFKNGILRINLPKVRRKVLITIE
ncbi:MAG: Hsp20/alpha crystallin family protein [archaeon]|nr:Hsp20/alpha crystallin family protein [archaeon]MDI6885317.1 Hsp20/alpha crystallin family protein [archaeon]